MLGRSDTGKVSAGGSEVQLLPLADTRSVESAVADRKSVYSRRDGLVHRSSGFRRQMVGQQQQQPEKKSADPKLSVSTTDTVTSAEVPVNSTVLYAQPPPSSSSSPSKRVEKGNVALAMSMKKVKLPTARKQPRVSGVFAGSKDCQWTVVSSDPNLTATGLFPLADISAPFKASLLKPV